MKEKIDFLCVAKTRNFDGRDYVLYEEFLDALSEREKFWDENVSDYERRICDLSEKCAYLEEQLEKERNKNQRPKEEKEDVDLEAVIYDQQEMIGELITALDVIMARYSLLRQNMG